MEPVDLRGKAVGNTMAQRSGNKDRWSFKIRRDLCLPHVVVARFVQDDACEKSQRVPFRSVVVVASRVGLSMVESRKTLATRHRSGTVSLHRNHRLATHTSSGRSTNHLNHRTRGIAVCCWYLLAVVSCRREGGWVARTECREKKLRKPSCVSCDGARWTTAKVTKGQRRRTMEEGEKHGKVGRRGERDMVRLWTRSHGERTILRPEPVRYSRGSGNGASGRLTMGRELGSHGTARDCSLAGASGRVAAHLVDGPKVPCSNPTPSAGTNRRAERRSR